MHDSNDGIMTVPTNNLFTSTGNCTVLTGDKVVAGSVLNRLVNIKTILALPGAAYPELREFNPH